MRRDADADGVRRFARELGRATTVPARLYLVGGASAVLEGWRASTLDIHLRLEPDDDELLRELPRLKGLSTSTSSSRRRSTSCPSCPGGASAAPSSSARAALYERVEDELFGFPAVDPASLREAVERLAR